MPRPSPSKAQPSTPDFAESGSKSVSCSESSITPHHQFPPIGPVILPLTTTSNHHRLLSSLSFRPSNTTHHHPSTSTAFLPSPALNSLSRHLRLSYYRLVLLAVDPPYLLHQLRRRRSSIPWQLFFSALLFQPSSSSASSYPHRHTGTQAHTIDPNRQLQSAHRLASPDQLSSPWLPQVCRLGHPRSSTIFTA